MLKHHPFMVDSLVASQKQTYRHVNCFGSSSLDNEEGRLRTGPLGSGKGPRGPAAAHRDGERRRRSRDKTSQVKT